MCNCTTSNNIQCSCDIYGNPNLGCIVYEYPNNICTQYKTDKLVVLKAPCPPVKPQASSSITYTFTLDEILPTTTSSIFYNDIDSFMDTTGNPLKYINKTSYVDEISLVIQESNMNVSSSLTFEIRKINIGYGGVNNEIIESDGTLVYSYTYDSIDSGIKYYRNLNININTLIQLNAGDLIFCIIKNLDGSECTNITQMIKLI